LPFSINQALVTIKSMNLTQANKSLFRNKRQKSNVAGPFDRLSQAALVLGTCPCLAPWPYTTELIHITLQVFLVLVINIVDMINAKSTNTPPGTHSTTAPIATTFI
jgi:hypothetical protein